MNKQELSEALYGFSTIKNHHHFNPLKRNVLLSDGAKFLADNGQLYWLMDAIAFGVGRVSVANAVAYMEFDGRNPIITIMKDFPNGKPWYKQTLEVQPSPFDFMLLRLTKLDGNWIVSLMDETEPQKNE